MLLASCTFLSLSTHGSPFSPSPMARPHSSTQQLQDQIHGFIHYSTHLCFPSSQFATTPSLSRDRGPHLSLLETPTSTFHYASPQWNSSWNHHWYVLITLHSSSSYLFYLFVTSWFFYLSDQFIACGKSRDIAHQLASRIWLAVLDNLDDNHHSFSMLKRLAHEGDVSLSVFLSVALMKKKNLLIGRRWNQPTHAFLFFSLKPNLFFLHEFLTDVI